MSGELDELARAAANALVSAMVTGSWKTIKPRFAGLIDHEQRLDAERAGLAISRSWRRRRMQAQLVRAWTVRLRDALDDDPALADRLRALLAELGTRKRKHGKLKGPLAIVIAAVIGLIAALIGVLVPHLWSTPESAQTPTPTPTKSATPTTHPTPTPTKSTPPPTGPPSASVVTVLMTEEAAAAVAHRPADAIRLYVPTAFVRDDACGKPNQSTTWSGQHGILQRYQQLGAFSWLRHQNAEVSFTPDNAQAASATATAQTAGFLKPSSTLPAGLDLHGNERWTFIRVNGKWLISSFVYNTACLAPG
jgi:hypothetical protein